MPEFSVIEVCEDKTVFGLSQPSNDRTQARDIPALSKRYYAAVGKRDGEVFPFYVISSGYDAATGDFGLFIGGETRQGALAALAIPKGLYGKVTVRPRLGFLWGIAIGEAKRAFYTRWLPESKYAALGMEYELHRSSSKGKAPWIDLLFAIREKRPDSPVES